MTLPDFISECDAFSVEFGVSRVWLSKRLFSDTFRLDSLAAGGSDVGVLRLEKARGALAALRRERSAVEKVEGVAGHSTSVAPPDQTGAGKNDQNIPRTPEVSA